MEKQNLSPAESSGKTAHGLVVFDGFCVLCSSTVKFLLKIDKNKILKFTTLHHFPSSDGNEEASTSSKQADSVIYIENGIVYTESEAVVHLLKRMGGIWKPVSSMIRFIPRKWRDSMYRLIARNRYRVFGQKKQCFIAPKKYADRFFPEIDMEEIK